MGGQSQQLLVRYHPKAMGKHKAQIPFKVSSESGRVVQEDVLQAAGSSLRQGDKMPLQGGTDKLPVDFEKPKNYLDSEQVSKQT